MGNSSSKKCKETALPDNARTGNGKNRSKVKSISFAENVRGDDELMGPILRREKVSIFIAISIYVYPWW